jgi:cyclic pyranopterin phosphate synthase
MLAETATNVATNSMKKGDVLGTARFAGVQAAKDADSYLPLAESALVNNIAINFSIEDDFIDVEASVESPGGGGVEMQALTAATVASLTIYDMCKSADRTMVIGPVSLLG